MRLTNKDILQTRPGVVGKPFRRIMTKGFYHFNAQSYYRSLYSEYILNIYIQVFDVQIKHDALLLFAF